MKILSYFFALLLALSALSAARAEPVFTLAEWKTTANLTLHAQSAAESAEKPSASGYTGLRLQRWQAPAALARYAAMLTNHATARRSGFLRSLQPQNRQRPCHCRLLPCGQVRLAMRVP